MLCFLRAFTSICAAPKRISGGERMKDARAFEKPHQNKLFTPVSSHIGFSLHSVFFVVEHTTKTTKRSRATYRKGDVYE